MNQRILIVDDSAFMRGLIKNILVKAGYTEIQEASSGEEAIATVADFDPHIVTLDITMPGITGIDTLAEIKKIKPETKVLMCSSMGQSAYIMEAIRLGASDFIVKPFEPDRVIQAVSNVCIPT